MVLPFILYQQLSDLLLHILVQIFCDSLDIHSKYCVFVFVGHVGKRYSLIYLSL